MANYVGRNRKRLQRDLRKGKTPRGMDWTDAHMGAYGNKRHQFVEDNIRNPKN
jgi:hypothetical protein